MVISLWHHWKNATGKSSWNFLISAISSGERISMRSTQILTILSILIPIKLTALAGQELHLLEAIHGRRRKNLCQDGWYSLWVPRSPGSPAVIFFHGHFRDFNLSNMMECLCIFEVFGAINKWTIPWLRISCTDLDRFFFQAMRTSRIRSSSEKPPRCC